MVDLHMLSSIVERIELLISKHGHVIIKVYAHTFKWASEKVVWYTMLNNGSRIKAFIDNIDIKANVCVAHFNRQEFIKFKVNKMLCIDTTKFILKFEMNEVLKLIKFNNKYCDKSFVNKQANLQQNLKYNLFI